MREKILMQKLFYKDISSPVGTLRLIANENALVELLFCSTSVREDMTTGSAIQKHPILDQAERQLNEYFAGKRQAFDLPFAADGTDFQKKVWSALCKIPYGKTKTYREIAQQIGQPKAVRAVGSANNRNPLAIIIPCHRVIGASGSLTGYGGGLPVKEKLLALEAGS